MSLLQFYSVTIPRWLEWIIGIGNVTYKTNDNKPISINIVSRIVNSKLIDIGIKWKYIYWWNRNSQNRFLNEITLNLQLMMYVELKYPRLFNLSLISHSNISSGFFKRLRFLNSRYWFITSNNHCAFISSGSVGINPEAKTDFSSFTLVL